MNLDGTMLGCKHVLPVMNQARKGSVINISSIVSFMATPALLADGASKAAVQHLTKSVAIEGCRNGMRIRCNSEHPGVIRTRMLESIGDQRAERMSISLEAAQQASLSRVAFGEVVEPDDVAQLIYYLASGASNLVTGWEIMVDGGWHLGRAGGWHLDRPTVDRRGLMKLTYLQQFTYRDLPDDFSTRFASRSLSRTPITTSSIRSRCG